MAGTPSPVELLAGIPLLAGLDRDALERLAAGSQVRGLRARQELFHQGDAPDSLAVVVAGRVEVVTHQGERSRRVRVVGRGGAVGELSLLTGQPRAATVRALRDSRLLVLGGDAFERAVQDEPALARALARTLAAQLQRQVTWLRSDAAGALLRPDVVAVVALDPTVPLDQILARAAPAVSPARVAVLAADGRPAIERLDEAEADHDLVVLAVRDPDEEHAWLSFAARAADRVLAVSRGTRQASWGPTTARAGLLARCDLALVGDVPEAVGRGFRDALAVRSVHRLPDPTRVGFAGAVDRTLRLVAGRSVGLVLSGGGARGLAHLGVLAGLEEAGVVVDRLGGCSMGALVAALAASGRTPAEALALARAELVERHPFSDWTVPRASLIRGRKAEQMLRRSFGDRRLEDLEPHLFTVSADLRTGDLVVHRSGPVVAAVGASMSIPGFAPPLPMGDRLLVDGGLLDNLPVDVMAADGDGPVIGVDVMRRLGQPAALDEQGGRRSRRDPRDGFTSIVDTIARSMTMGAAPRAAANRERADLLLAPDVASIGLLDFDHLDRAVAAGRDAVRRAVDAGALEPFRRPAPR